jgi:hypothetical protein
MQIQIAELNCRLEERDLQDHWQCDQDQESDHESLTSIGNLRRIQRRPSFEREENKSGAFEFHIKIPEFSGTLLAKEFIDWLNEIEWILKYMDVPEHPRVKLVVIRLKSRASVWW